MTEWMNGIVFASNLNSSSFFFLNCFVDTNVLSIDLTGKYESFLEHGLIKT